MSAIAADAEDDFPIPRGPAEALKVLGLSDYEHSGGKEERVKAAVAAYKKLAMLDVDNCMASRPEDKEDILAKIADKKQFNATLQIVIFGDRGLLRQKFEGLGAVEAAARVARRILWTLT